MLEISQEDSRLSCFGKTMMFSVIVFQLFIDKSNYFLYYYILDMGFEKVIIFAKGRL